MWPEVKENLAERMKTVHARAEAHGRVLDYGLRVHMIVRDTEQEARDYADHLVSQLDDEQGELIKQRALDAKTMGVNLQVQNRMMADAKGYTEDNLWTGVGRARSGCGAALVGSEDQVLSKIEDYRKMGIRAFIFSGYPHYKNEIFGTKVLPELKTCSLPVEYGRVPTSTPKRRWALENVDNGTVSLHETLPLFSRMVYGMWRLNDDSNTSDGHIIAIAEACLEQGITTMDHADLW